MTASKLNLVIERDMLEPSHVVYSAIKNGLLFVECGADRETMKIDFTVGGSYSIDFGADGSVEGTFTQIDPDNISFTWSQQTHVQILLEPKGERTSLRLTHFEVPDEKWLKLFKDGWNDGLNGLETQP
ncbi:MAG: SRPBCC domain-containing protein [Bdellovibrionaceae bacterium]|nr:SRPBCC domain-containing protein [Pseudobdellovibrionaceae bacterium]